MKNRVAYCQQGDQGVRVRDLVDMPILMDLGIDKRKVARALRNVCIEESRELPTLPAAAPAGWRNEFDRLARSCQLTCTMREAHDQVVSIAEPAIDDARRQLALLEKVNDLNQRLRRKKTDRDKDMPGQ